MYFLSSPTVPILTLPTILLPIPDSTGSSEPSSQTVAVVASKMPVKSMKLLIPGRARKKVTDIFPSQGLPPSLPASRASYLAETPLRSRRWCCSDSAGTLLCGASPHLSSREECRAFRFFDSFHSVLQHHVCSLLKSWSLGLLIASRLDLIMT